MRRFTRKRIVPREHWQDLVAEGCFDVRFIEEPGGGLGELAHLFLREQVLGKGVAFLFEEVRRHSVAGTVTEVKVSEFVVEKPASAFGRGEEPYGGGVTGGGDH